MHADTDAVRLEHTAGPALPVGCLGENKKQMSFLGMTWETLLGISSLSSYMQALAAFLCQVKQ